MGFAQLYYTSCETGLSGFAGFQFNAATPGLPPEVLRSVEALTSYKPPRSLGPRPTAAEIDACPVNLVYTLEPTAILAHVRFVGTDFSHRSGNYFAHALVSETGADAFDKVLPIELWDSGDWVCDPVDDTHLPVLEQLPEPLPDGTVSREEVGRFLGEGARGEQLVTLLTAAESAVLREGRPIVIVDPDPDAAARWIAAISFLLPPVLARQLSFATYHHNPGYIDVHVIGTTPDSDFDLNEGAFRSYVVLDGVTGRLSEVEPAPAAMLLVRAGLRKAAALWEHAGELAEIPGTGLADWHPALVMAALTDGPEVTECDLDVLSDWLQHQAGQLRPGGSGAALRAFLASPSRKPRHLAAFGAVPLGADPELAEQVDRVVVAEELRQIMTASEDQASTGVPLTTAAGRQFATDRCAEQLAGAPAGTALALLGWSTDHGLRLPHAVLRNCGEQVLGPQLILAPDEDTLGVVAGDPALAEGALAHLAAVVAEQPEAVERALAAGLGDIADTAAVTVPAGLREADLLATVRTHPEKRAEALREVVTQDQQPGQDSLVSEGLLCRIWPAGGWTAAEALEVVQAFGPGEIPLGPVRDWVARAAFDPLPDGGYLPSYTELCRALSQPEARGLLPAPAAERVASFLGVAAQIKRAGEKKDKARADIIRDLAASYGRQPPPAQEYLRRALAAQPVQMTGSSYLGLAVETYPEPVVTAFLDAVHKKVVAVPPDIGAAARLFRCLAALRTVNDGVLAPGLEHTLAECLGEWRRADLAQLHKRLRAMDPVAADFFDDWRRQLGVTGAQRPLRRFLESRSKNKP